MNGSKRLINFELLRIISMFLVLLGHYIVPIHGVVTHDTICDNPLKSLVIAVGLSLTSVCVNGFIILSGYFGIRWKWSGLFNFLFMIFFWAALLYPFLVYLGYVEFSIQGCLHRLFLCYKSNWFFVSYLILYAMSPIMNTFIECSSEKRILYAVLAFYFVQTYFGYIIKIDSDFYGGMSGMSFLGLYLIGGYIRKSTSRYCKMSSKSNITVFTIIVLIMAFFSLVTKFLGSTKEIYSYINPVVVIESVFLFLFCKSITIKKYTGIVTFLASSAFSVLLIHSWEAGALYSDIHQWIYANLPLPLFMSLSFMVAVFFVAAAIDKVRMLLWRTIADKFFLQ